MNWYAAHVLMAVRRDLKHEDSIPVFENVVLLRAATAEAAWAKAEAYGQDEAADPDPTMTWGGHPARWEFTGIRKVTECVDASSRPSDGTEITYTELRVESPRVLAKLAAGKPVTVGIAESFADENSSDPVRGKTKQLAGSR